MSLGVLESAQRLETNAPKRKLLLDFMISRMFFPHVDNSLLSSFLPKTDDGAPMRLRAQEAVYIQFSAQVGDKDAGEAHFIFMGFRDCLFALLQRKIFMAMRIGRFNTSPYRKSVCGG